MVEVKCVFCAHYKTRGMNSYDLGQFEVGLLEKDAYRLLNDCEGRLSMFLVHYPQAVEVDRNNVVLELFEKRG